MRLSAQLVVSNDEGAAREYVRDSVNAPSTLRATAGIPFDVHIRDLSGTGCFVESSARLQVDDTVKVGLAGSGAVGGKLVRVAQGGFGVRFDRILTYEEINNAFKVGGVVSSLRTSDTPSFEYNHGKWSRPTRVAIILGSAVTSWCVILWAFSKI